ncbi:heterokaryon incompatibility protein-domain-containing protein [Podospora conica]|nr:heterokaryon incompatibility protein-domain-containing protein [Schizothecium conicum]
MRLINTSTLQLQFFTDDSDLSHPPYAILSHTWGDEEVTFQEINGRGESDIPKKGWKKIVETCRLAKQYSLGYAWVDTCCIDQSSSAELSEAINTMFKWYRRSTVCFVFLEDVEFPQTLGTPGSGLQPGTPEFRDHLRTARWFSRGWTLQELIAPKLVVFYDALGFKLGNKTNLADDLVEITNIDRAILHGHVDNLLPMIPVAKKMSWAASRRTTRVEDIAYCLLGIFDVNMPLLYGEGAKAFSRLQEEIARSRSDLSLFAWSSPPSEKRNSSFYEQISGVFASSPSQFWDGHRMRLPGWAFEQDVEPGVADRGFLRINQRNIFTYGGDRARLILDCLVTDSEALSGTSWLEVDLRKTGSFYVRTGPSALFKRSSRRMRQDPGPGAMSPRESVTVATTISTALVHAYRHQPLQKSHEPCLFYTSSLRANVKETQGVDCSIPLTIPKQIVEVRSPTGKNPTEDTLARAFISPGDTIFLARGGVFSTKGIHGSRYHHLFEFNSTPLALIWCQDMSKASRPYPWAVLLHPGACQAVSGDAILHPDVFRITASEGGLSEETRSKILHDYVFQWYSDDTGAYRTENIPTRVRLTEQFGDTRVVHEIEVHVLPGLRGFLPFLNGFPASLVLSYRQLPEVQEA